MHRALRSSTDVTLGIVQILETCCRCGRQFESFSGAEETAPARQPENPLYLDCGTLDCVQCGKHYEGQIIAIMGTVFTGLVVYVTQSRCEHKASHG